MPDKIKYAIARTHPVIHHLPQFRPIKRGARQKAVERQYTSKNGETTVTISMFKELDIADQDLLLAILAIALPHDRGAVLDLKKMNNTLISDLELKGELTKFNTLSIKTNSYELIKELGKKKSAQAYEWLIDSLDRLCKTYIKIDTKKYIGGTNFLSYFIHKETKEIEIAINPISAVVLMGDSDGYIFSNRHERLQLKYDTAKALHSVLVGLVNIHSSDTYAINMLIEKVYIVQFKLLNKDERKNRKKAIMSAVSEINQLQDWNIIILNNNRIKVSRNGDITNPQW